MELPNAAEISPTVALEKRQGMESDISYNCPIIDIFGLNFWKAIAPEPKLRRNSELGIQSVKGL